MNATRKYKWLTAGVALVFIYLLLTEVPERWSEAFRLYANLQSKDEQTPEQLLLRRAELEERAKTLAASFAEKGGHFEQSETGIVEFLNASARKAGISVQSLVPSTQVKRGQIEEIAFTITASGQYHNIGRFVNQVETDGLMVQIRALDINSARERRAKISTRIDGSAFIIPGR